MHPRLLVAAAVLPLCGCVVETAGPTQHDFRTIELEKVEAVRLNLRMGAGTLRVGSGTQKLMRADFAYNVPSWKPYVRYDHNGSQGDLTIEQPESSHKRFGNTRYEWDLKLSRDVPVDLHVKFGAGQATLDVGSLDLKSVDVDMGVGKLVLDLRGAPKRSFDVRIRGGVGEATVRLPAEVGVHAEAEGGIGEIKTTGLHRNGRTWVNDAYQRSKTTIRLDVRGGIGAIRLISD
jgi:hypothetical protein